MEELTVELRLKEGGESRDVSKDDEEVVEAEAEEAHHGCDRVPEHRLQEQLVNDYMDNNGESRSGQEEVILSYSLRVLYTSG